MHTPKAPQPPSPACEGGNRAPPPAEDGRRPDCSRKPLGRSFTGNVNDLPRPSPEASYGSFCGPCGVGGGFDRNVLAWTKAHCPSWTFGRPSGLVGLDVRLRRAVAGFGGGVAVLAAMDVPRAVRHPNEGHRGVDPQTTRKTPFDGLSWSMWETGHVRHEGRPAGRLRALRRWFRPCTRRYVDAGMSETARKRPSDGF